MTTNTTSIKGTPIRTCRLGRAMLSGAISLAMLGAFAGSAGAAGTLSVTKNIPQAQRVAGPGIDCGTDCSEYYPDVRNCEFFFCSWQPQKVTVTTSSGNGFRFDAWTGCDVVDSSSCVVEMRSSRPVSASYTDISDPNVSLTTPGAAEQVGGTVALHATATDNWGIARVEFLVDGDRVAQDETAPYAAAWNTHNVSNGSHEVAARAVDRAGRSTTVVHVVAVDNTPPAGPGASEPAPSDVDTTPPDTQISSGPKLKTRKQAASFEFSSSDPAAGLQCSLDGIAFEPCGTSATYKVGKGSHDLEVRAIDVAGNVDPTPAQWRWKVKPKR